jgi:hypothetical protein
VAFDVLPPKLIHIKDSVPYLDLAYPMIRRDEHNCDPRWSRFLRLVLVVLFAAWNLAGALHTPGFAAPSDGASHIAAHQVDGGSADHHHARGQACAAQVHCSGLALIPTGSMAVAEPLARWVPSVAAPLRSASIATIDRPPITSFSA